jgi:phosphatidylglycerol:prolipoprotein diacylglycerol transferase
MRRVLFRWKGITLHAYPAFLYIGLLLGLAAGRVAANVAGLDPTRTHVAMLLLTAPALFGARLWFAVLHWPAFRRDPTRLWRRSDGGAALYGGFVLALAVSLPLLATLELPLGSFWDAAIFTMLVGMVFTKIGCLLNGCCAGRPTDGALGLELADHRGLRVRRVPTQLFEAGLAMVLLGAAALGWRWLPSGGWLFLAIVAAYGCGRALLEGTRATIDRWRGLSINRLISLGLTAASLAVLLIRWSMAAGTW